MIVVPVKVSTLVTLISMFVVMVSAAGDHQNATVSNDNGHVSFMIDIDSDADTAAMPKLTGWHSTPCNGPHQSLAGMLCTCRCRVAA